MNYTCVVVRSVTLTMFLFTLVTCLIKVYGCSTVCNIIDSLYFCVHCVPRSGKTLKISQNFVVTLFLLTSTTDDHKSLFLFKNLDDMKKVKELFITTNQLHQTVLFFQQKINYSINPSFLRWGEGSTLILKVTSFCLNISTQFWFWLVTISRPRMTWSDVVMSTTTVIPTTTEYNVQPQTISIHYVTVHPEKNNVTVNGFWVRLVDCHLNSVRLKFL